jgi:hypothetical protein
MAKATMTRTGEAVAVALGAYEAYVKKDRQAIEKLIGEDFHFTSRTRTKIDRVESTQTPLLSRISGATTGTGL